MAQANIELLKKLRNETSASIADCRTALEETDNNFDKAKDWLKKRGLEKAAKKSERETHQGLVEAYIHQGGKVGVLTVLLCETDFVARTEEFRALGRELGMQIAAMKPESVDELLKQDYIRDPSMKIEDLIKSVIGKLGENITLREFQRFEV